MVSISQKKEISWPGLLVLALILALLAATFPLFTSGGKVHAAPADPLVGYGAGTTGGAGGSSVTVTSLAALTSAVSGSAAKIVNVQGTISGATDVHVGSNKTIQGVGSTGALVGISLNLDAVSNVIIRNLSLSFVKASDSTGDAIHIIDGTNHVWVDHNTLFDDLNHGKDYYDGLVDITRGSDYVTVSWNYFHNHFKVSLVGHSDTNGSQDTGHLHVTYHHNWFSNVGSRLPSLRFGTGHVYNNYFQNVTNDAVHSRENAQMLVQNNVFVNCGTAITTTGDSKVDGFMNQSGNSFTNSPIKITRDRLFHQSTLWLHT